MNQAILIGRLGKDPETRHFENGQVTNITLATSRKYTDKQGQKQEVTQWHNLVMRGKQSEIAEKYLTKGAQIAATGEITYRSWESEGQTKWITEIAVRNFEMLGGTNREHAQASNPQPESIESDNYESDLPF